MSRSSPMLSLNTLGSFVFELCCEQTNKQTNRWRWTYYPRRPTLSVWVTTARWTHALTIVSDNKGDGKRNVFQWSVCQLSAHSPHKSLQPSRGVIPLSLWRMARVTPDLRLPSQPQSITALWPVANYTAWSTEADVNVNNLPMVATWQQRPGIVPGNCTSDLMIASETLNGKILVVI